MHITVQVRQSTASVLQPKSKQTAAKALKQSRRSAAVKAPRAPVNESAVRSASDTAADEAADLLSAVHEIGVALEPTHPDTRDPHLQTFFTIEVADPYEAKRVINRLQRCSAVEAAYLKPADELP